MKLLICIDDTDNLDSKGTGSIASEIQDIIINNGWGTCGFVTRHQLLLHPDVPYTSHNSSMCFSTEINEMYYEELKSHLPEYLGSESAEGSDPGICIADLDKINDMEMLMEFGFRAKSEILKKNQAYEAAARVGVFLEERGGTGDGVIGALAGVGLRLNGNDGEVKGGIETLKKGQSYSVEELLKEETITGVYSLDLNLLPNEEVVTVKWKAKPVLHNGQPILLVSADSEGKWQTLDKTEMRRFGDERTNTEACSQFVADVPEELISDNNKSCFNCAYRRWTANSFLCTLQGRNGRN